MDEPNWSSVPSGEEARFPVAAGLDRRHGCVAHVPGLGADSRRDQIRLVAHRVGPHLLDETRTRSATTVRPHAVALSARTSSS